MEIAAQMRVAKIDASADGRGQLAQLGQWDADIRSSTPTVPFEQKITTATESPHVFMPPWARTELLAGVGIPSRPTANGQVDKDRP